MSEEYLPFYDGIYSWMVQESQDFWTAEEVQNIFNEIYKATTKNQLGKIRDTISAYYEIDKLNKMEERKSFSSLVALCYETLQKENLEYKDYQEIGKMIGKYNRDDTLGEFGLFPPYQWKQYKGLENAKGLLLSYFTSYVIVDFVYNENDSPAPPRHNKSKLQGQPFTIEGIKYIYNEPSGRYRKERADGIYNLPVHNRNLVPANVIEDSEMPF